MDLKNGETMTTLEQKFGDHGVKGKRGEDIVKKILKEKFPTALLIDRTQSFIYQKRGIDFTLILEGEIYIDVDIKSNAFVGDAGDIILALELEKADKSLGWFYNSQSEWIVHYCEKTDNVFYYDRKETIRKLEKENYSFSLTKKGDKIVYFSTKDPRIEIVQLK